MILLIMLFDVVSHGATTSTVTLTAPVNPVTEGSMLALHCQIKDYNFQDGHEVTLSRVMADGKTKRLSWDKELVGREDDERVFLAIRQLSDTSVVYFMSITDVVREDVGTYECKVVDSGSFDVISGDAVNVDVNYFPSDSNPECQIVRGNTVVRSGDSVTLNCSTNDGFPPVDIAWSRSGYGNRHLPTDISRADGMASGTLTFRASQQHREAVFSCTITSEEFPGLKTKCHIGPLKVQSNPNEVLTTGMTSDQFGRYATTMKNSNDNDNENNQDPSKPVVTPTSDCTKLCSSVEGPVQFWIISTVVGALMALIFCLLGVCLSCKIRHESRNLSKHTQYVMSRPPQPRPPTEDMYESLDRRNVEAKVYMAIERLEKGGNTIVYPGRQMEEIHYNVTPSNASPKF